MCTHTHQHVCTHTWSHARTHARTHGRTHACTHAHTVEKWKMIICLLVGGSKFGFHLSGKFQPSQFFTACSKTQFIKRKFVLTDWPSGNFTPCISTISKMTSYKIVHNLRLHLDCHWKVLTKCSMAVVYYKKVFRYLQNLVFLSGKIHYK